ncbi:MAG: surface lipoprotein assembly modifier [Burkholderiales bacterium]
MRITRCTVASCLAAVFSVAAQAAVTDEVKALLEQGKSNAAYELGKQHPEQLGDPAFDFFYGVAAIDTGNAGEGVLALERYIINYPGNTNARLELARGYYVLGEDSRSSEEFKAVLKTNPPSAVKANIQRYLDAIRARESRYKTSGNAYLEAGFGYDSNVNAGVDNANITLPLFGTVTLQSAGVKARSRFEYFAVGGQLAHPVAPGVAIFGAGSFDTKFNNQANQFDQRNLNLSSGLTYLRNKNFYRLSGSYSRIDIDNDLYRQAPGATGEWFYQFDELQSFNTYLQYARFKYEGTNRVRDSDFYAAGVGYRKAFIGKWQPLLTLGANYAKEDNITGGREDLSRDIYGGRVAFGVTPFPKWAVSVSGSYQRSLYRNPDIFLVLTRRDNYYSGDAAISYAFTPNLSARVEYLYAKNDSNLALFEYRKEVAAFKLRYDFK